MVRLLHLADLHLGWEPKYITQEKRQKRRQTRDKVLRKAVDFALEAGNEIHGVLLVGDLFEKYNPEKVLVDEVIRQLERLTCAGKFLLTVPGNHDEITYNNSVYREARNRWPGYLVTNPMPEKVLREEINGIPVYFYSMAYTGGLTFPGKIHKYPRMPEEGLHIGCFHGSLDWEGIPDRSLPLNSKVLEKAGYHYIALGHYHTPLQKSIGEGKGVYPGALEFKSFHDRGTGELTVAEIQGKNIRVLKYPIEIQPHQEKTMDITGLETFEELLEQCKEDRDNDLLMKYRLSGTPGFSIDEEELKDRLSPYFFYVEVENESHYFSDDFLEKIMEEPTIRGIFAKGLKKRAEESESEEEKAILEQALLEGLAAIKGRGGLHG